MKGSVTVEGAAPSEAPAADDHGGPMAETDVAADPERAGARHPRPDRRRSASTATSTTSTWS